MTRSRTRRVRKARLCCSAARYHVAFHDKHFHGCILRLYLFFCLPDGCLRRGPSRTAVRKIIFTPKRATCVAFSLLPSSPGSFSFSASNQPQTHCGCLFVLIPRHLQIRNDPVSPLRFVLLICDGCSLLFSPPKGLLSLCPSLLLLKCFISPSHHHQASKTAHR